MFSLTYAVDQTRLGPQHSLAEVEAVVQHATLTQYMLQHYKAQRIMHRHLLAPNLFW